MTKQEYLLNEGVKKWNIIASILFITIFYFLYKLFIENNLSFYNFTYQDIIILTLANFRLIRLFVYDNITLFLREYFMDINIVKKDNQETYEFINSKSSLKLTIYKLLTCPWCFGIWTTFVTVTLYNVFPLIKIISILLAISGVASAMIILINLIGWNAEYKKIKTNKL